MKSTLFRLRLALLALAWLGLMALRAPAHPMGNFSINHYTRFGPTPGELKWRTVLDFAEIATAERMAKLDLNGDGKVSPPEKQSFLRAQAQELRSNFSLSINGQPVEFSLRPVDLSLPEGAGGLPTMRLAFESRAPWPAGAKTEHRVEYRDSSFEGRTGWKEIVAQSSTGARVQNSNAMARDLSRELTIFPEDAALAAPAQTQAAFSVALSLPPSTSASTSSTSAPSTSASASPPGAGMGAGMGAGTSRTPQNRFTQSIAQRDLSPGAMMLGLLVALGFGAVHALSPGHGKTMVAAYLVGTRGTPRHAALLGLVVTITHTMGVFALALVTLFATNYIVPERLYPILSTVSGLLILSVGFWLLLSRVQDLQRPQSHHHDHDHSHDHGHEDGHTHSHDGVTHSHGGRAHTHAIPEGPVTARALVALGISGGIVPCPEALVVLLAAVKMGRIGYGLGLITAFSIGLAAALIAIGLSVVAARRHLSRWERLPAAGALMRYLPIASAAVITVIGVVLTLQAAAGGTP